MEFYHSQTVKQGFLTRTMTDVTSLYAETLTLIADYAVFERPPSADQRLVMEIGGMPIQTIRCNPLSTTTALDVRIDVGALRYQRVCFCLTGEPIPFKVHCKHVWEERKKHWSAEQRFSTMDFTFQYKDGIGGIVR